MVKFTFSIAATAAMVASVVNAAPMTVFSSPDSFDGCVPGVSVKEYHPFYLESVKLRSPVSKAVDDVLVVGGVPGNKDFEQLELCVVGSDYGCDRNLPSNCIYPNVEYRFRVNSPVKGYLYVNGTELEIVHDFNQASGLNLYREEGWGLRVAHRTDENEDGRVVFATNGGGRPITLEKQRKNDARQWFEILGEEDLAQKTECVSRPEEGLEEEEELEEQGRKCLSDLRIYQPFRLNSINLDTYIAKHYISNLVMSSGNPPLVICAAFGDFPCNLSPPKFCVVEGTYYYIRAELPNGDHGFFQSKGGFVRIVSEISEADKFNLFKDDEGQVKIGTEDLVFTAEDYGRPIELKEPSKSVSQEFRVEPLKP